MATQTAIKPGPQVGTVTSPGAGMRGEPQSVRDAYDAKNGR